jgi:hypothetical protein
VLEAAHVEERLVDREALDERRRVLLLASEYADMRGGTTTRPGQSRRAVEATIAVRTPYAFAS